MSAFSPTEDRTGSSSSLKKKRIAGAVLTPPNVLEVALRTLKTLCVELKPPSQADEAYLRQIAGDQTTPIDDLARRIIESELRVLKKGSGRRKKTWSSNYGIYQIVHPNSN